MAVNAHPGLLQDGPLTLPLAVLGLLSHLATPFTIATVLMLTKRQQARYRLALAHEGAAKSHHESATRPVGIDQQEGEGEEFAPVRLVLDHADAEEPIPFAEEVQPPMAQQWRSRVSGSSVSRTQMFVLVGGLAALTLSSIYVPWEAEVTEVTRLSAVHYPVSIGYNWIWNQTTGGYTSGGTERHSSAHVLWSNVYPLWVGIAAGSAALFLLVSRMGRRPAGPAARSPPQAGRKGGPATRRMTPTLIGLLIGYWATFLLLIVIILIVLGLGGGGEPPKTDPPPPAPPPVVEAPKPKRYTGHQPGEPFREVPFDDEKPAPTPPGETPPATTPGVTPSAHPMESAAQGALKEAQEYEKQPGTPPKDAIRVYEENVIKIYPKAKAAAEAQHVIDRLRAESRTRSFLRRGRGNSIDSAQR